MKVKDVMTKNPATCTPDTTVAEAAHLMWEADCGILPVVDDGEIDLRLDQLGLVILDESQYLADPERGVVWEETIIFCPGQARLLLLSASIGNPQDIADWLTHIRPSPCQLVKHARRSVPLRAGYMHPNGKLTPLFRTVGIPPGHGHHLHPETLRLFQQYEQETLGHRG